MARHQDMQSQSCSTNNATARNAACIPNHRSLSLPQLQAERDSIESQFKQLYHDKYQPLKMAHQAVLDSSQQLQEQQQQAVEKLRTQLATADLKVRKAGLDVQSLSQQLQQSQDELQVNLD